MRFTIYSYTFYKNKDKMKEIILIGAVMAMFAFGFYIMDKVDHFLNDNYSRMEVMEHTSALRIAMEDSSIAASLSDLLEEFSKRNPDCDIYFMTENIREIRDGLTVNDFDLGCVAADCQEIQKEGYSSALIMLERNSLSTAVIDIPIVPIDTTPIKIKVLWKRDLYKWELNQFVELLKQYDKSCDAIA